MPAGDMLRSVSPSSNCCYSVLVDNDESCPTADLSNIGRSNGPAYSTGELLNTPRVKHTFVACHESNFSVLGYKQEALQLT